MIPFLDTLRVIGADNEIYPFKFIETSAICKPSVRLRCWKWAFTVRLYPGKQITGVKFTENGAWLE